MKTAEEYFKGHCIKNSLFFSQDDTDDIIEVMKIYARAKLDEAADRADIIDDCIERRTILSLKDKI